VVLWWLLVLTKVWTLDQRGVGISRASSSSLIASSSGEKERLEKLCPAGNSGRGLHDGCKAEDGAATFLGRAEGQGDRGSGAGELEVLRSSGDYSLELRLAAVRSWRALVRLGFGKEKKRKEGADAEGFTREGDVERGLGLGEGGVDRAARGDAVQEREFFACWRRRC
jgi:hypothetical protein